MLQVEKYNNIGLHTYTDIHTHSMCKYEVPNQVIKSLALSTHVVPVAKLCHCIPVASYMNLWHFSRACSACDTLLLRKLTAICDSSWCRLCRGCDCRNLTAVREFSAQVVSFARQSRLGAELTFLQCFNYVWRATRSLQAGRSMVRA